MGDGRGDPPAATNKGPLMIAKLLVAWVVCSIPAGVAIGLTLGRFLARTQQEHR